MSEATKRMLDVGQCDFDHARISQTVEQHFPGVVVDRSHTLADTLTAIGTNRYDLVLVNRKLDRGGEGMDVIRNVLDKQPDTQAMLVSNYEDAQETAVEAGAKPGFGKNALSADATIQCLAAALGRKATPTS